MPQSIAVLSQKGGTGKTTAVRTLADAFRRSGIRTLAVDLDPQGNLSDYFDLAPDGGPTIADVLSGRSLAVEAIREDLIPADLTLAEAELALANRMGRELVLRRALAEATGGYEVVLIDCPPSLGLLTVNALVAADRALITSEAQYFASQGVERSMEVVELARECLNPKLSLLGVLINMADMQTRHSRAALATLTQRFGKHVFGTVIRASIAYAESAKRSVSILDHRPDLGVDYLALAGEVLERLPGWSAATGAPPDLPGTQDLAAPDPDALAPSGSNGLGRPPAGGLAPSGSNGLERPPAGGLAPSGSNGLERPPAGGLAPSGSNGLGRPLQDELDTPGPDERAPALLPGEEEWPPAPGMSGETGIAVAAGQA